MLSTITEENLIPIWTKCNMSKVQAWTPWKENETKLDLLNSTLTSYKF
jgi:hypothetical protein